MKLIPYVIVNVNVNVDVDDVLDVGERTGNQAVGN